MPIPWDTSFETTESLDKAVRQALRRAHATARHDPRQDTVLLVARVDRMNQSAGAGIKTRQGSMRQARAARPYRAPGSDLHVRSRGLGERRWGDRRNSLPGRN